MSDTVDVGGIKVTPLPEEAAPEATETKTSGTDAVPAAQETTPEPQADPKVETSTQSKDTESKTTAPDEKDEKLKQAEKSAREFGSKFASLAKILFESEDKSKALEVINADPQLARDLKRRFPEEFKKLEQKPSEPEKPVEEPALKNLAERLKSESQLEKMVASKNLQKELKLADDEFRDVKEIADQIMISHPSLDYESALKRSVNTLYPEKIGEVKTPVPQARSESVNKDDLRIYEELGFHGEDARHARALEKKSGIQIVGDGQTVSFVLP